MEVTMPNTLTYPGVYIQEIPSGVRTIMGVATSITAFIGRAYRGPTNEPVMINNFGDFGRTFGGLREDYLMSYAVRDFYLNGGSQAIILRLVSPLEVAKTVAGALTLASVVDVTTAKIAVENESNIIQNDKTKIPAEQKAAKAVSDAVDAAAGKAGAKLDDLKKAAQAAVAGAVPGKSLLNLATATPDILSIEAANEGAWGNALRARVDYDGVAQAGDRYTPLTTDDLFNLTVRDTDTGTTERFLNLAVKDSPRRVDRVLENESNLVRVHGAVPTTLPKEKDQGLTQDQMKIVPFSSEDIKQNMRSVGVADKAADGGYLDHNDITAGDGLQGNKRGLYALDKADIFNLLCIPPEKRGVSIDSNIYSDALPYCRARRAMLIVDSPAGWSANKETAAAAALTGLPSLNLIGEDARNAALFFPHVIEADPKREGQLDSFVPCGMIAGVMARTDAARGVWKAPAGLDATLNGIQGLELNLTDDENGMLNPRGINCLRFFPVAGRVIWGARTLRGADQLADDYKYIPVRRLALYIEESLYRGTQWIVFEPNDEPLWAQIRLNLGAFMHSLFRQGAFQGMTPKEAYFVKCDKETTIQDDINKGIVNIVVGFAPLKPAEFVVINIQQIAGQIQT